MEKPVPSSTRTRRSPSHSWWVRTRLVSFAAMALKRLARTSSGSRLRAWQYALVSVSDASFLDPCHHACALRSASRQAPDGESTWKRNIQNVDFMLNNRSRLFAPSSVRFKAPAGSFFLNMPWNSPKSSTLGVFRWARRPKRSVSNAAKNGVFSLMRPRRSPSFLTLWTLFPATRFFVHLRPYLPAIRG